MKNDHPESAKNRRAFLKGSSGLSFPNFFTTPPLQPANLVQPSRPRRLARADQGASRRVARAAGRGQGHP